MRSIGLAALGLSLITATAAYAQTTVTREISEMPVETTITRSPSGTVITRRVLPTVTEVLEPSVTRTVTTRRPAYASARAQARIVRTRMRRVAPVYALATAMPAILSPEERDFVYSAIIEQSAISAPSAGVYAYAPGAVPAFAAVPAVRAVSVVGARLPRDIPLIELPDAAVSLVPAIAPFAYATVGGRVLLVDPRTGMIVYDITG